MPESRGSTGPKRIRLPAIRSREWFGLGGLQHAACRVAKIERDDHRAVLQVLVLQLGFEHVAEPRNHADRRADDRGGGAVQIDPQASCRRWQRRRPESRCSHSAGSRSQFCGPSDRASRRSPRPNHRRTCNGRRIRCRSCWASLARPLASTINAATNSAARSDRKPISDFGFRISD